VLHGTVSQRPTPGAAWVRLELIEKKTGKLIARYPKAVLYLNLDLGAKIFAENFCDANGNPVTW